MNFLVDAQLSPPLAQYVESCGHHSTHVSEVGLTDAEGLDIWDYAAVNNFVVITKEEDFQKRRQTAISGPSIIWLRVGNCYNQALIKWFGPMFAEVVDRIMVGETLIEVV